jgi:hypothetical protein
VPASVVANRLSGTGPCVCRGKYGRIHCIGSCLLTQNLAGLLRLAALVQDWQISDAPFEWTRHVRGMFADVAAGGATCPLEVSGYFFAIMVAIGGSDG